MPRVCSFIQLYRCKCIRCGIYHRAVHLDKQAEWIGKVMTMTGIDLLGFAAGTLTTCAFWPQLQKTWTSKSAGDVSLGMLAIFSTGVCLWFLYGLVLHSWPIIVTNFVTLL